MTDRLRVRPGTVEWRQVEDEIVALDLRSSLYLALNPAGSALWPALVEGATRDELVARLCDEWAIDRETAEPDVDGFLAELRRQDLLEP